jgi:hypothetical protein
MLKIADKPGLRLATSARRVLRAAERGKAAPSAAAGAKRVLGWKENVVLPTLGGIRLMAKLDTGARTSALHAVHILYVKHRSAIWVEFDLPDVDQSKRHRFRLPLAEHRAVKSSIGSSQIRPVVVLELVMAGQAWSTEVTLTDRSDMELPMLVGRSALKGRFIVDPSRTRLAGRGDPAKAKRIPAKRATKTQRKSTDLRRPR